ncbi:MAG: hypothetical protein J6T67_05815 [Paludibacteraceae bacterium]|nr:hypothetical protein [Paludibacteraceae bacterium]
MGDHRTRPTIRFTLAVYRGTKILLFLDSHKGRAFRANTFRNDFPDRLQLAF